MVILQELHQEVRRLFIAGSGMAQGDIRLGKLAAALEQLGERTPVFRKLAEAVRQVTAASGEEAAIRLLELGTLLHSVLYTQGQADVKGEEHPLEHTSPISALAELQTTVPYRKLKPLMEALTERGAGRLEVIRQAHQEELFRDMRVYNAAVSALNDPYAEIADYIYEKVILQQVAAALPILLEQFRPEGGKGDARRLLLIHNLDREAARELCTAAMQAGSVEVKSAAIEIMSEYPEYESVLLDQAADRKKDVREAALTGLSRLGTEAAADCLYQALTGKDREIAILPVRECDNPGLAQRVLLYVEEQADILSQHTAATDVKLRENTAGCLEAALKGLVRHRGERLTAILARLLSLEMFYSRETRKLPELAAQLLLEQETTAADQILLACGEERQGRLLSYSFPAALRHYEAGEVYDRYERHFRGKLGALAVTNLLQAVYNVTDPLQKVLSEEGGYQAGIWDKRWMKLFVELDQAELVCRLAEKPDKGVIAYLLQKLRNESPEYNRQTSSLVLALYKLGWQQAPEELLKSAESKYYLDYEMLALLELLPAAQADRVEKLADSMRYEGLQQQISEIARQIRQKQGPEQTPAEIWAELAGVKTAVAAAESEKGAGWFRWIKNKLS